jgi:DNA-binding beta-propeller fold protein YncE
MWRHAVLGLSILTFIAVPASAGIDVPEPVNGVYSSTLLATDSGGRVFCFDGDTVYGLSGGAFSPIVSGIGATAGAWVDPSGFAVNAAATMAYVATGFSGRIVEVDLVAQTSRELSGARIGGFGNYGVAVDPIYGKVFVTDSTAQNLYTVDPSGSGLLAQLKDFSALGGVFGGGITFAPGGRLIVPVATAFSQGTTDDNFPLDLYSFSRSFLDSVAAGQIPAEDPQRDASGVIVSGSGGAAADSYGDTFILAADAIYKVDSQGTRSVFVGDPSVNVFDFSSAGVGYMGLAYDAVHNEVLFAHRDTLSPPWQLEALPAPEPATLALVAAGAAVGLAPSFSRGRHGRGRRRAGDG